jgi:hypothetical protein
VEGFKKLKQTFIEIGDKIIDDIRQSFSGSVDVFILLGTAQI